MTPEAPFSLPVHDRQSDLWLRLMKHFGARLEMLRRTNDAAELDERQTAALRGGIAELKRLIALNDGPVVDQISTGLNTPPGF